MGLGQQWQLGRPRLLGQHLQLELRLQLGLGLLL